MPLDLYNILNKNTLILFSTNFTLNKLCFSGQGINNEIVQSTKSVGIKTNNKCCYNGEIKIFGFYF